MSRRHAPTTRAVFSRAVGVALAALLVAVALLPATALAQGDDTITPRTIQQKWQLLTQRDEKGDLDDVPAGVGARMQLRSGAAFGEAACSTYDSTYNQASNRLDVFVEPDEIVWRECDDISREFDELFYSNLSEIASIAEAGDVLIVKDVIGDPLMVFTRTEIENDPTAARWDLARISDVEGASRFVLNGVDPWMEFLVGGSLVGDTGCGSFLGKYDTNEGRVDITDVHYRLSSCPDGVRVQAEEILRTLAEISDFQVRPAGLALKDENGITRLGLTPDLDVASRSWTPTAIYGANGKAQQEGNELSTSVIQFLGSEYQGKSICRSFRGKALRSGLAVSIGQPEFIMDKGVTAAQACKGKTGSGQPLDAVEGDFIITLEDAASYALRGDELTLIDVNGVVRAVLEPQPPLTGTIWAVFKMRNGKKLVAPKTDTPITAAFEEFEASTLGLVAGNTGVSNRYDENTYFANFNIPAAARIQIDAPVVSGNGCKGNRGKTAVCKNEQRFLNLLQQADTYIVRAGELWLADGRKTIITLRPLQVDASDE